MGSLFSKNMGLAPEPASADASGLARTIQQQNLESAAGLAKGVELLGGSIWAGYKQSLASDLEDKLANEVSAFQTDLNDVKSLDTANKAMMEREQTRVQNAQTDYFNAAILAGSTAETAASQAAQVKPTVESSVLTSFRNTQEKLMAARDSMPQRQHEMMLRSETILKEYIAKMPGMANNFRQIAEEVTGKRGLDLYSVNRLYEDVNFIERQSAERAKQQAAKEAQLQSAYVNDRKNGGVSETQAIAEYSSLDADSRMQLANISAAKAGAKANAESALKLGGEQLQNYVTSTVAKFDLSILEQQAAVFAQLQALGVNKAQLRTNTVPDSIRNKPEYIAIMEKAGANMLTILDVEYKSALNDIQKQLTSNVIDSGAARTAKADLDKWYEDKNKFYTENKTSPLLAFATEGDPIKLTQQRLTLINTYSQTLQLPPEVVTELLSSDPKTAQATAIRYPKAKQQLDYLNSLTSAALRNVSNEEWMGLLKQVDTFKTSGISAAPVDNKEASAALININQEVDKLSKKVLLNEAVTYDELRKIVSSGMSSPANAETFYAKGEKAFEVALSKLTETERKELNVLVTSNAKNYLYGFNQYGDMAKTAANTFKDKFFNMAFSAKGLVENPKITFKDSTGLAALQVVVEAPMKAGLSPADKNRYEQAKYDIQNAKPVAINNRLEHVDTILRMQSKATGVPITQLRQEFMQTFNKEGMPSSTYVAPVVNAINAADAGGAIVQQIESVMKITGEAAKKAGVPAQPVVAAEGKMEGQLGIPVDNVAIEERRKTIVVENGKAAKVEDKPRESIQYANPPVINNVDRKYGKREDGTFKGAGWFGEIVNKDNKVMTEFSTGVNVDGRDYLIPIIVPTLSANQLKKITSLKDGEQVPKDIVNVAVAHAMKRIKENKSPFAEPNEIVNLPSGFRESSNAVTGKIQKQSGSVDKNAANKNKSASDNAGNSILQGLK